MKNISLSAPEKCPNCGSENIVIASFEPFVSCGDCDWEQKQIIKNKEKKNA